MFSGPALPEPFVRFELGDLLGRQGLLPAGTRSFERGWSTVRAQIRALGGAGGPLRAHNHIIAPLALPLGFGPPLRQEEVSTREGLEDGGWLMQTPDGTRLRAWSVGAGTDLDAPHRSGRAYRFSPTRSAHRVLRAGNENAGLLTDGEELRLLLCDPSRPDSHVAIPLTGSAGWRDSSLAPDSVPLADCPRRPTRPRRVTPLARRGAVEPGAGHQGSPRAGEGGGGELPASGPRSSGQQGRTSCAATPRQPRCHAVAGMACPDLSPAVHPQTGKLEHARRCIQLCCHGLMAEHAFSQSSTGSIGAAHLDQAHDTGRMLEDGLRTLFRVFSRWPVLQRTVHRAARRRAVRHQATLLLERLVWGEHAVALLLDQLLWTASKGRERARVQYGPLDVEDLGRVYEALLELEPGIAAAPMARLRRAKLEVVVPGKHAGSTVHRPCGQSTTPRKAPPVSRGWRPSRQAASICGPAWAGRRPVLTIRRTLSFAISCRKRWRRKSASAVRITIQIRAAILSLKIVDPATGSGHFLVEACRYLGEALYAAECATWCGKTSVQTMSVAPVGAGADCVSA